MFNAHKRLLLIASAFKAAAPARTSKNQTKEQFQPVWMFFSFLVLGLSTLRLQSH